MREHIGGHPAAMTSEPLLDGDTTQIPNGVMGESPHSNAPRVAEGLAEEGFAQARLMAKTFKGALLTLVAVLALWQLEFARQIVLAAFLIAFGALGVAFALAVGLGSAKALDRGWDALFEKRKPSGATPGDR